LTGLFERDQLKKFKSILKGRSRMDMARFQSVGGKHAGAWLRCLAKGDFRMKSEEFSTACILRLGCKFPFISPSLRCDCGKDINNKPLIGEYGEHLHVCNNGNERFNKHNKLTRTCEALANYAGIKTKYEPNGCFVNNNSAMRPDLRLIQPNYNGECRHDLILDITVTHPATQAKINNNKTDINKGRAARLQEQSKNREYAAMAENNDLHFSPIVFETYGTVGKIFADFLEVNALAGWRKSEKSIPLSIIRDYWKKRFSVVLQVMNARMLLSRVDRVKQGSHTKDESFHRDNIIESRVRVSDLYLR